MKFKYLCKPEWAAPELTNHFGYDFQKGHFTLVEDEDVIAKLMNHPHFECDMTGATKLASVKVVKETPKEDTKEFPTESKEELEAWADEHLNIDLDRRKSLANMILEVEKCLLQQS